MVTVQHDPRIRTRSHAETAFAVLRALIRGQVLFAGESGLSLTAVAALVDAPPTVLRAALGRLLAEGVVTFDAASGVLRLSRETLADLAAPAVVH
jgi:DNA-binding GntR family transcriptional regulator